MIEKHNDNPVPPQKKLHPKIEEYVARARSGEDVESITNGLPEGMKSDFLEALKGGEEKKEEKLTDLIPRQYINQEGEPLAPDILDDIWTVPIYADEERTKSELARKRRAVEASRVYYENKAEVEKGESIKENKLEEVRVSLGLEKNTEEMSPEAYSTFRMKHGDTMEGEYWWYEYKNLAAKKLKESGKLEWGKERIYFDVPVDQSEKMRDLFIKVASDNQIAVAFKYRDAEKTHIVGDDQETRLVANFASADDAAKFYRLLSVEPDYLSMKPDRAIDYKGIRLDDKAEYASSYREARGPLERIAAAIKLPNGNYRYLNSRGTPSEILPADYEVLIKKWEEIEERTKNAKRAFGVEV